MHLTATERDLEVGLALERELTAMLDRDGLGAWGGGTRREPVGAPAAAGAAGLDGPVGPTGSLADQVLDDQGDRHDLQENHP